MKSYFQRERIKTGPLKDRRDRVNIEKEHIDSSSYSVNLTDSSLALAEKAAADIREARKKGAAAMLVFGAHSIKNGLAPVFSSLIEQGWITHLATNGAGIIHDWEFAFQGTSSEDVRENVSKGQFGTWEETGFYLNLAFLVGAYRGLGYGESA